MRSLLHTICVFVCVCVFVSVFTGCKDQQFTYDENAYLVFSADSINFDTVFTSIGSSTRIVMVYNPNDNAVRISRVWWQKGQCFYANLDGENNASHWRDIEIYGGDSLFLFIRTQIDPYNENTRHPIEVDTLFFELNGHIQSLAVQAYGMNVEKIQSSRKKTVYDNASFSADKPYLIFDTIVVKGTLSIAEGATFYMHNNAHIIAYGNVSAVGSKNKPIRFMGDRTDYLFPYVPYRVASGQWGGIYLLRSDSMSRGESVTYNLQNIHLLSGQVGLWCYSDNKDHRARLRLHNARIHNMSAYGLVLENTDADISNVEISNCAAYGMYLCGGTHHVEQSSIANYFGYPYTTLNIHNTTRQDVAAVYILASCSDMATSQSSIYNSIITGAVKPALVIDSIPTDWTGCVSGCYLRCDSDSTTAKWGHDNTYVHAKDTVFKNTYYKYGEYIYYDFHLHERSAARQIGLPLDSLYLREAVLNDLEGDSRDQQHPDAGCYISK